MTDHIHAPNQIAVFEEHLKAQYVEVPYPESKPPSYYLKPKPGREQFDMEDEPEIPYLMNVEPLYSAIDWMDKNLAPEWSSADQAAIACQAKHKKLVRTALITGFGAIILALVQLALKSSFTSLVPFTIIVEAILLVGCFFSFFNGNKAGSDLKWLAWRHRAERLRMLKFRALGQPLLWEGQLEPWKSWLNDEIKLIPQAETLDKKTMEKWSEDDNSEPFELVTGSLSLTPKTSRAFALYYRYKRLIYQRAYFAEKGWQAAESTAVKIREHRNKIFYATIAFVLLHFLADILNYSTGYFPKIKWAGWEVFSIWLIAIAAAIPVSSVGFRAWSAAFELCRKAKSFSAKDKAMQKSDGKLQGGSAPIPEILIHLEHDELFLEQEHREWLRTLLDAEWFV